MTSVDRWWKQGKCSEFKDTQTGRTKELDLYNVGGVFIVLAFGVAIAIIICLIELIVHKWKQKCKSRALVRLFGIEKCAPTKSFQPMVLMQQQTANYIASCDIWFQKSRTPNNHDAEKNDVTELRTSLCNSNSNPLTSPTPEPMIKRTRQPSKSWFFDS